MTITPDSKNSGAPKDPERTSQPAGPAIIKAENLRRTFGSKSVLSDVNLTVPRGTIQGFVGPSGSGKTTTVRMLTGVLSPTSGSVKLFGTNPQKLRVRDRQRIGYMPQLGVLYPELSILENLRFCAALYSVRRTRKRINEVLDLLDLGSSHKLPLGKASGGMQRRVALAGALLHHPELLFLDEPTSGLDPILRRTVWTFLQDLRDNGTTIFVTTQIVSEATMCDRVGLIADGDLVADNAPAHLRHQALGGDVLDVHTENALSPKDLSYLRNHGGIVSASRTGVDGCSARLVVGDIDSLQEHLSAYAERGGIRVRLIERYLAPFDDVFVALLDNHRAQRENEKTSPDSPQTSPDNPPTSPDSHVTSDTDQPVASPTTQQPIAQQPPPPQVPAPAPPRKEQP